MDFDIATISAAANITKTAVETLKTVFSSKEKIGSEREVNEAFEQLGKVQDKLIELRGAILSLQDENYAITKELRAQQGWNEKANNYELRRSDGGHFVFASKLEPFHWSCPVCFEAKRISILQPWSIENGTSHCRVCKMTYNTESPQPPPPQQKRRPPYG